jgi:hypothetical protein
MKTKVMLVEGVTQLMLTPDTHFEKMIIEQLQKPIMESHIVFITKADIGECQGGYLREYKSTDSLIINFKEKKDEQN